MKRKELMGSSTASTKKKSRTSTKSTTPPLSNQKTETKFELIDSNFSLEERARQYLFYFRAKLESWVYDGLPKAIGSIIISYWLPLPALISMLKVANNLFDKPFFPTIINFNQINYLASQPHKKVLLSDKINELNLSELLNAVIEHKKFLWGFYRYENQIEITPSVLLAQAVEEEKGDFQLQSTAKTDQLFWNKFSYCTHSSDLQIIWEDFLEVVLPDTTISLKNNLQIKFFSKLLLQFAIEIQAIKNETNVFTSRALLDSNDDLISNAKFEKYELKVLESDNENEEKKNHALKPFFIYLKKIPYCKSFEYKVKDSDEDTFNKGLITFDKLKEEPQYFDQDSSNKIQPEILTILEQQEAINSEIDLSEYHPQAYRLKNIVQNPSIRQYFSAIDKHRSLSKSHSELNKKLMDTELLTLLILLIFKSPDLIPHLLSFNDVILEKDSKVDIFPLITSVFSTNLFRYTSGLVFEDSTLGQELSFNSRIFNDLIQSLKFSANPVQRLNELCESKFFIEVLTERWLLELDDIDQNKPNRPWTTLLYNTERELWTRVMTSETLCNILINKLSTYPESSQQEFWMVLIKKYWKSKHQMKSFPYINMSRDLVRHYGKYFIVYHLKYQFSYEGIFKNFIFYLDALSRDYILNYVGTVEKSSQPSSTPPSLKKLKASLKETKNFRELPNSELEYSHKSKLTLHVTTYYSHDQQDFSLLEFMKQKGIVRMHVLLCCRNLLKESLNYILENYQSIKNPHDFYSITKCMPPEYEIKLGNIDFLNKALECRFLITDKLDLDFYGKLFLHFIGKDSIAEILFLIEKLYPLIGAQELWLNPLLSAHRDEFNHPILYILHKASLDNLETLQLHCPTLFQDWLSPYRRLRIAENPSHIDSKKILNSSYSPCRFDLVLGRDEKKAQEISNLHRNLPVLIVTDFGLSIYGRSSADQWRLSPLNANEVGPLLELIPNSFQQPIIKASNQISKAAYTLIKTRHMHIQPFKEETLLEIVISSLSNHARIFLKKYYPGLIKKYFDQSSVTAEKDQYLLDLIYLEGPSYPLFSLCCEHNLLKSITLMKDLYKNLKFTAFPEKLTKDSPELKILKNGNDEVFFQAMQIRAINEKSFEKNTLIFFLNAAQFYQKTDIAVWLVTKLYAQINPDQIWNMVFKGREGGSQHPLIFLLTNCNLDQLEFLKLTCPNLLNYYPVRKIYLGSQLESKIYTRELKNMPFKIAGDFVNTLPNLLSYIKNPHANKFYQDYFPQLLTEPSIEEHDSLMLSILQTEGFYTALIEKCFNLNLQKSLGHVIQSLYSEEKNHLKPKPILNELINFACLYKRIDTLISLLHILYYQLGPQGLWLETLVPLDDKNYSHPMITFFKNATHLQFEELFKHCPKIIEGYPAFHIIQKILKTEIFSDISFAKRKNYALLFKDLLGKHADTAFSFAVSVGSLNAVNFLLKRHPEKLKDCNRDGETCLKTAVETQNMEIIQLLLKAGIDSSDTDSFGDTIFDMENISEEILTLIKSSAHTKLKSLL